MRVSHRMQVLGAAALAAAWILFAATPVVAQSNVKIGVFNAQRLSEETEEGKRVQAQLEKFRDQKQAEIKTKEQELADLQNRLSAQALSLSAEKRAALEKEIQRKVLELNQAREAASRELQLEIAEAQERFQQQLLAVIQEFGREEGFTVILESSLVAYADESVDITTALVDRFNQRVRPSNPGS